MFARSLTALLFLFFSAAVQADTTFTVGSFPSSEAPSLTSTDNRYKLVGKVGCTTPASDAIIFNVGNGKLVVYDYYLRCSSTAQIILRLELLNPPHASGFKSFQAAYSEMMSSNLGVQFIQVRGLYKGSEVFPWHDTTPNALNFNSSGTLNYTFSTNAAYHGIQVDAVEIRYSEIAPWDSYGFAFKSFVLSPVVSSYTVSFDLNGGTRIGGGALSQTVNAGAAATAPTLNPPVGKSFTSWSTSFSNVQSNLNVVAQYADIQYTVDFNLNGGTHTGGGNLVQSVPYGGAAVEPQVTRPGYTHTGWDVSFNSVTSNLTVTAQYTINSYTVTFNDFDGTFIDSDTVEYLGTAIPPADPTRTGYSFIGWSPSFNSVTENMTVTAQYSINSYTVSFVDYDSSPLGSDTVEYLTAATAPADPTRTGHTFSGWDVGFDSVTADITVTAQYTINSYTVSFVDYDNSPLGSDTVEYLQGATAPADPTRTGHTFSGWDAAFDSVTENITVTAQYTINSYTVTFNDFDGTFIDSDTVEYLTAATAPADPTRTGYTFSGWDVDFGSVSENMTVTAQYSINSYTVSFVDYDNSPLGSDTVEYLTAATAPADPTRTGHTFSGWDVAFDSVTENITVTAQYSINSYTVSFVDYDSSPLGSDTVEYLTAATAPADPTRTGYTFSGWDVGFDSVTENMTVTAQYTINSYTVSFVDYDSSPLGSDTVEYLQGATAPADPTRTGYTFSGWDVSFDSVTADITVTAQYSINSYTVSFVDYDSSPLGSDTVEYLQGATAPADPTRTGYTFSGWDVSFDSVTENMTVTAQYTINSYTVSFVDYDNSPLGSDTVEYLASATAPADPTRTGYTFSGWDVSFDSVTENMTVTAQYSINSYTVSFVDYDSSPLGSDTVEYLQGATAPADPTRTGYTFSGWDVTFDSVTENMTVTAQYTINSYTVSFVDYDNSPLGSDTVEYLQGATAPADPTRTGYSFAGWDVAFDSVTENMTVTAQYSINSYTVSFVDYDSSPLGSDTVEYLTAATAPADPTRTGHTFSGWDVAFDSVTADITVTAQYSINSYTVSFVDYDSSPLGSDTVEYLTAATAPADPTRTGYTFSGWDVAFDSVTADITVTAQYSINSYTVSFVDYDSSPLGSDTVEYLQGATAPADPTRTGYTFSGWDVAFDSVTENMTVTAQYTINSYTVSFVDYDSSPLGSDTVEYLQGATAPADPTRTGHTFSGWDVDFGSVSENMTVTAQYTINSYTVSFVDYDSSPLGSDTVEYLTAATAPADPTRTGYTFSGWDVDFGSVSENMTVTAQYSINSYTVSFVDYDSSPLGSDTVEYLQGATAPADPTRTGYTFTGWDVAFDSVTENMTVTAQYTINSYTVSFVDYDNSPLGSDTVEYLQGATAPADPTRTGYTFAGWDVGFDSVTADITVTAQYTINSYTVTFVDYDSSPLGSDTVEYLQGATAPADPTRIGHTFSGWDVDFGSVSENMTVTAQYTINSYTVSFVDYDSSPLGSDTVEYLTAATAPADPTRTGYTFSGWDVAFDSVTENMTVTAQYTINSYTVTFNDFDGTFIDSDTVEYLQGATAPADPTRTGYTFSGWDVGFDSVTADITVTAQYTINSYTVSFVDYDSSPLGSDTVEYLTAATAPADPTRTGHTFSGWDVAFDSVTADITVTAQYSINSYTVTFNDFDGTFIDSDTVEYLQGATAPADPTRTGYTFSGWDVAFDSVTADITVTAQYSINSYTVSFVDYDSSPLGSDTVEYLTAATAPADPTRTGYTFSGWDVAFDSVTVDITVTAQYTINSYTVSFVDYDSSPLGSDTVEYLTAATAPADPTRTGYTFSGWDADFTSVTEDMTVTAQYTINSYTVTFVDFDGAELGTDTVEYLTAATAPEDPTRTGYTFSGWDAEFTSVTEDMTVTAQYTINSYTVTFVDFDGAELGTDTVEYLTAATAPEDPTRTGYTFTGWDTEFDSVVEDLTVTAEYYMNPVGQDLSVSLDQDTDITITPEVSGAEGGTFELVLVTETSEGTLDSTDGGWLYTPAELFSGFDNFTYRVMDGEYSSVDYSVSIEVLWVNTAPVAMDDVFELPLNENGEYLLDVLANDTDVDEQELTILSANASIGSVSIEDGQLLYRSPSNFVGVVNLTYNIMDESEATDTADVRLVITGDPEDEQAPQIDVPANVRVNATGLLTRVELGTTSAVDVNGDLLPVSTVDGNVLFAPGRHVVYWRAEDAEGRETLAGQEVWVDPLVSLSRDQTVPRTGEVTIRAILNGNAPEYPVAVPYYVEGTADMAGHNLFNGVIYIEDGREASLTFELYGDQLGEGNPTIVVVLDEQLNRGARSRSVITAASAPTVPDVQLAVFQGDQGQAQIAQHGGNASVVAQLAQTRADGELHYTWSTELAGTANENPRVFSFDPSTAALGVHEVQVTVSHASDSSVSKQATMFVEVVAELPNLGDEDSNGNGIPDRLVGRGDSNRNGIPDYLDGVGSCNVISQQVNERTRYLTETEASACIRRGGVAMLSELGAIQLNLENPQGIEIEDEEYRNTGGMFDFVIDNLSQASDSVYVVIPQRQAIPAAGVYRKYLNGEWAAFVENERNALFSAVGEPGICPPPASAAWQPGLQEGHYCVQLYIEDGGPNDADGVANGTVVDPGGVAVLNDGNTVPVALNFEATMLWNRSSFIDLQEQVSDEDGDALQLRAATADIGVVTIDGPLTLRYEPPTNFAGSTVITYSVSDGNGGVEFGEIRVVVSANELPVVQNENVATDDRTPITIDVLANDYDPEGTALIVISASAQQGEVEVLADYRLRYTPAVGFGGVDTIQYTVQDEGGAQAIGEARVSLVVVETIEVKAKVSRGSWHWWMIPLALLIAFARRAGFARCSGFARRGAALAAALVLIMPAANASSWEVELAAGRSSADHDLSALAGLGVQVRDYQRSDVAMSLHASYWLSDSWRATVGYVDLGSGDLTAQVDTTTPAQTFAAIERETPVLGSGVTFGMSRQFSFYDAWQVNIDAGVYDWLAHRRSVTDTGLTQRTRKEGSDLYFGASVGYQWSARYGLRAQWRQYQLNDTVNTLMLGVWYRW
ncbi:InlB B-repeat-containing protein [Aliidiomarina celeris]|uniref:InlB B-repeat-containing protein n=1 Tax=Aliidiomarina celeris TaxID=2249428 RepID=UPI0022B7E381|nr:InlB B-repeat-containing protein [Aliidiomarina celeris]